MKNPTKPTLFIILFFALYSFACINLISYIEKNEVFVDEPGWVSSANYYTNLLLHGDFQHQKWECTQCENWGSLNPHLGQWIIGLFLKVQVPQQEPVFFNLYNFQISMDENIKQGNIPPRQILLPARSISAIFGILSGFLIFFIGYFSNNKWLGGIAALLLLGNQLFITLSTQAMTDVYYNFFLLCGCLSSVFLLRRCQDSNSLLVSSIYGCFAGLASSVKITGLLLAGLHFVLIILYIKMTCKLPIKNAIQYLAVFFFSALIIIYSLNPYFWPSFKEINGEQVIKEVKTIYSEVKTGEMKTENMQEKYPQLSNLSHPLEFPYLFVRWNKLMDNQLKNYAWTWKENRLRVLHESLFIGLSTFPLEWCFFCIGMFFYGRTCVNAFHKRQLIKSVSPFLFFLVNYVFILAFMKISWDRYYLPPIIASKLIVAAGIYQTYTLIYAFILQNPFIQKAQKQRNEKKPLSVEGLTIDKSSIPLETASNPLEK